jgi:transposase
MQGFVQGTDRQQTTLFPECLDDLVDESNPVRAVDVFVDALELRDLGFDGVDPAATGRPAYHPSAMLKLYIYGYLNRVQSSRRLEREAGRLQCAKCGRHHEPSDCRARGHQHRYR